MSVINIKTNFNWDLDADLLSFNCRGMSDKIKRNIIFNHLKNKSKKGIFLLQETHSTQASEYDFKKDWNAPCYFSHLSSESGGVAVLISPGLDLNITELKTNDNGRTLYLKIHLTEEEDILLCNIYAPTRNKVKEQLQFLGKVKSFVNTVDHVHLLQGGDFNTVFDPKLDKQGGDMLNCTNQYTSDLINFMETQNMVDVLRMLYPDKKMFTRTQRNPLVLSRIDHWLISEQLCNYITSAGIYPGIKSDHSIIFLNLSSYNSKRGRGFWKFNSQLLQDKEYTDKINVLFDKLDSELVDMEDKGLKWDYMKCEVRSVTLEYSITKNKKKSENMKKLYNELENLHEKLSESASSEMLSRYEETKAKIEFIEQDNVKGAIIRSKVKWVESGEKNTKYFLNLEKRNAINKTIIRLEKENGQYIENQKEILETSRDYFKNIYTDSSSHEPINNDIYNEFFIKDHLSLNEDDKKHCEGILTIDECAKALNDMKNGKSPGSDGFTAEFYKHFWPKIGKYVLESLNYAYVKGELSVDQRRGIITLIPKKGKKRILLKNWRPISLLNTDYKILTKSLAFRLKKVLPSIIDHDQTGFLEGRYIGENIRTISDLIEYTSLKNSPGIILLIDFEKAFDTIQWRHLMNSLKYFNFGESFIHWIQVIYSNIESTIINNGHTSQFFSISRGIRQGCPISPYLFIIAVEVLAISIRANKNIKGIKIGSTEFKLSQLADDTTLFLLNLLSVKNALICLKKFHMISGLLINMDKTLGKGIGSLNNFIPDDNYSIKWTTGPIATLGVTISNEPKVIKKHNFDARIKVMSDTLNIWLCRNLSLNGKVTILKSLALPLVQYPAFCLPITYEITQEIEKQVSLFLWKHGTPKVKKNVIIQSIEDGGIKAPDFTSIVHANKVMWVKRLLTSKGKWPCILHALIEPLSIEHLLQTNLTDDVISSIPLPFYRQVLQSWNKIKEQPSQPEHYLEQILWENKLIQSPVKLKTKKTHTLWYPKIYSAGIVRVKDLIDSSGNVLDYNAFIAKYGVNCNILSYYKIVKAIPKFWLTGIKELFRKSPINTAPFHCISIGNGDNKIHIYNAYSKSVYNIFIKLKQETPTSLEKWQCSTLIEQSDWSNIFRLPYLCCRETQLQALQYRIIHRFLPCNKWLYNISIMQSNICDYCDCIDTIEHYMYTCNPVKQFWNDLELWWNSVSSCPVVLTEKHVIFGIYYDLKYFVAINFVIILAKMYIYRQKLNKKTVYLSRFLKELKQKLEIEKTIADNHNTSEMFNSKWSNIMSELTNPTV